MDRDSSSGVVSPRSTVPKSWAVPSALTRCDYFAILNSGAVLPPGIRVQNVSFRENWRSRMSVFVLVI